MNIGFSKVVGQKYIKNLLLSSLKTDKINHAYIFEGDEGMGKKTLAYAFASYLMCDNFEACGQCASCKLSLSGNHPDIITVLPEDGRKTIGVDEIRLMVANISVKPYIAKKKVFIIPESDKLTRQAQNALLKALEESPEYAVFIMLAQNANNLLETVRSRSIKLTLSNYTDDEIKQVLPLGQNAGIILSCAGGNLGRAHSFTENSDFMNLRAKVIESVDAFHKNERTEIYTVVDLFTENKDSADMMFDVLLGFFRDVQLIKLDCDNLIQNVDELERITEANRQMNMESVIKILEYILKSKDMLRSNVNYNLLVTWFANSSWEVINGRNSRSSI